MKIKFNLRSTIKNALFVGLSASIGAAPAGAQQTPQTYCATLPPTSCEVLNVEPGGTVVAYYAGGALYGGIALIKYCRNRVLMFAAVNLTPYVATTGGGTYTVASITGLSNNNAMCASLP